MELYYEIVFFIFGTIFGSFFNVVGDRLPEGKSIAYPPSHCTFCGHHLKPYELVPLLSYLFLGGKCKQCKHKLSMQYFFYELFTGLLFMFCFIAFGWSLKLLLALTFVSLLMIVIISDVNYYIIPDEVIIAGLILLPIEIAFIYGIKQMLFSILYGFLSFLTMYLVKKVGDFIFKKESMGGGDIKLMALFGIVLGYPLSVVVIFLASIIGLPISLLILLTKKTHEIPFGPFLSSAAMILFLLQVNFNDLVHFITY